MNEAEAFQGGIAALQAGRGAEARDLFAAAVAAGNASPRLNLGLALANLGLGDTPAAEQAIDQVLTEEPHNLRALIIKGDLLIGRNDPQNATAHYNLVLRLAATLAEVPAPLAKELSRIESAIQQLGAAFQQHLLDRLAAAGYRRESGSQRFNASLDMLLGRAQRPDPGQPFPQVPHAFYMADIPYCTYYPVDNLPWMATLEAETDVIEEELAALLAGNADRFSPYVHSGLDQPQQGETQLLDSDDWTSAFLWRDSVPDSTVLECCPRTRSLMETLPLTRIRGLAPSVLFSKLDGGARIDPHSGLLNCRLICHLPLTVPDGCGLRVGEDRRETRRGVGWAFDDSINHEAWNNSDEPRIILLFDVWRPELDETERHLITTVLEAVSGFGAAT
ncbi:MAG: aspartyl/asparaginyl beta-hydroxylase domain-containing protein [Cellvibrionales bacterium]|jgi:aspartyl/asparaginyl beta-hydroxylase (cupin superfamily)